MVKKEVAKWNVRVSKALDEAVNDAVTKNRHYRRKLKTLGINPHQLINNLNHNHRIKHNNHPKQAFTKRKTEDKPYD